MPTQFLMPRLGESVDEATLTKWLKNKGETVKELEPLLEVNTDKVDTEIASPASGVVLDILVQEGASVNVGTLLAWIGQPGEAIPTAGGESPAQASPAREPAQATPIRTATPSSVSKSRDLGFISPVVARITGEYGVDLQQVPGTGQAGRITKKDVLVFVERRDLIVESGDSRAASRELADTGQPPVAAASPAALPQDEVVLHTPVRRRIAEHMVSSKHTSPHVTTVMEVDLSRVAAHRQAAKDAFLQSGVNLTFTAYFASASVAALKAHPIVNSSWGEQGILLHRQINLGIATSLGEAGLIVPVIKNADSLSLLGLVRLINDLAQRARSRRLAPDEVKGGTFTITNHGVSGSLFATPIINQPQCAILGVGAIQKRVVVVAGADGGDQIAVRPMAYVSLTFDHRILDGVVADSFLAKVVETLQNWK